MIFNPKILVGLALRVMGIPAGRVENLTYGYGSGRVVKTVYPQTPTDDPEKLDVDACVRSVVVHRDRHDSTLVGEVSFVSGSADRLQTTAKSGDVGHVVCGYVLKISQESEQVRKTVECDSSAYSASTPELSMGQFFVTQPNPWVNPTYGQLCPCTPLRFPPSVSTPAISATPLTRLRQCGCGRAGASGTFRTSPSFSGPRRFAYLVRCGAGRPPDEANASVHGMSTNVEIHNNNAALSTHGSSFVLTE